MKIGQVSSSSNAQDKLNAILAYILSQFKIFQVMEFSLEPGTFQVFPAKPDVGNADNSVRSINGDLKKFVYSPTTSNGQQRAYGFEFQIDQIYLNDLQNGVTTPDGLRRQIENEQLRLAKKVATDVLYDLMNGNGIGNVMLGLKTLIADVDTADLQTEVYGFTKEQIHASLVRVNKQLDLNDEVLLRTFDETLMIHLSEMAGNPVLVLNNQMFGRMTSIAKILHKYGTSTTDFGKPVELYGNYPMIVLPQYFLPQTESDGAGNVASSIYGVEYNEADGVRIATNAGFRFTDFDTLETKPTGQSRLEFYGNTKVEDMKKIKRFSRIKL